MTTIPHLIPVPKEARYSERTFSWIAIKNIVLPQERSHSLLSAVVQFADELEALVGNRVRIVAAGKTPLPGRALVLSLSKEISGEDAYQLDATAEAGICLRASSETGLFYGMQTLRQLLHEGAPECPEFQIEDAPDFAVRGFYHDVTRGAVPTLETLCRLADKMAYYKMNQLQLYVEHTFAFANHSDIWGGSDPLTSEESLRLQDYCENLHIELVPSISTFGHFYMALCSKRLEDLNELEVRASERPFSFCDRMAHYTLNPNDPRSLELVREILDEYLPLFRSRYCNICCDETFDLGKGRNKAVAPTEEEVRKLYVTFLKKIIACVKANGKDAMFWGDIIEKQPELISELPEGTIPLEWDYGPEAKWWDTEKLAAVAKTFYICPGTTVWNRWLGDADTAQLNILNFAKKGLKYGAKGLLNTNWGDYGNINLLAGSWNGLAFGAAASWNTKATEDIDAFDAALDSLELGGEGIAKAWRELAKVSQNATWTNLSLWVDPTDGYSFENDKCLPELLQRAIQAIPEVEKALDLFRKTLIAAKPSDPLAKDELLFAAEANLLTHRIYAIIAQPEPTAARTAADDMRALDARFCALWHRRNKPSECYRVREAFLQIAKKLDAISMGEK